MFETTPYGTVSIGNDGAEVSATHLELYDWATRPNASWPCSTLRNLDEISAGFDARGDLVELETVDVSAPDSGNVDLMGDELSAWILDVVQTAEDQLRAKGDNAGAEQCYAFGLEQGGRLAAGRR